MSATKKSILEKHNQLSKYQQILAEILIYAYMADKDNGVHISRGRTTDLEGNKKIIYQIEVEE